MSVRMLRRALKEQEAQDSHRVEGVIADEDDDTPNEKPAQNLFNLLGSEVSDLVHCDHEYLRS